MTLDDLLIFTSVNKYYRVVFNKFNQETKYTCNSWKKSNKERV